MPVKRETLRVDREQLQGAEMSARGNIHIYASDCMMSPKSMGEGFLSVHVETEFAGCHLRLTEGACWLHFGAHGKDGRVFHDSIR